MNQIFMSRDEIEALRSEIVELETVKLPEVKKRIDQAAAEGDLRENDTFDVATNEMRTLKGIIEEKRSILNMAKELSDTEYYSTSVRIGSEVTFLLDSEEFTKKLAPSTGDNFLININPDSLLGRLLLGKETGDKFKYSDRNGARHSVTILSVM